MSSPPPRLVARTAARAEVPDPLSVLAEDGALFAEPTGRVLVTGASLLDLDPGSVAEALGGAEVDDPLRRPGTGPVAVGALPFRTDAPARLTVPRLVVGREPDGRGWVTTIGTVEQPPLDPASVDLDPGPVAARVGPSRFTVTSVRPPQDWCDAVARATERIRAGDLEKVVLAREIRVEADAELERRAVLGRLRLGFPGCYVYAVGDLVGASPELLVRREGEDVHSQPMAGTAPRRGDPDADADAVARLLASPSYRHEHQVTIDAVCDALVDYCSFLDLEAEPSVVALPNVTHLATTVTGRLSQPPATALELVTALHPTPAVCGHPRGPARALIDELEGFARGPYAGAVGWVDGRGDGCWAVTIRCARLDGTVATVYGGNGIVADSDPATELVETRAKLQALLGVLVRP